MKRLALAALAGALLLSACQKKVRDLSDLSESADDTGGDASATVDVATISSLDELPREIVVDEPYLKADVRFDEALFSKAPAIAMDIVDDAQIRIEAMSSDAQEYQKVDPDYFRPYGLRIDWNVIAESGNVMSLEGFVFTMTAGAHGNYFTDARLYDSVTGAPMRLSTFFGEPQAAVREHINRVWEGIAEQKVLKSGQAAGFRGYLAEAAELVSADMVLAGEVSFVPSTKPGKFGGYTLHFAPYDLGSYAEGSYHITVPQLAFRSRLKQEYLPLFGGEPVSVQRKDD